MGGENDQFLKGEPQKVHKALTNADATLVMLASAEGAGEHTHAGAARCPCPCSGRRRGLTGPHPP
jgi:hypothetical protein